MSQRTAPKNPPPRFTFTLALNNDGNLNLADPLPPWELLKRIVGEAQSAQKTNFAEAKVNQDVANNMMQFVNKSQDRYNKLKNGLSEIPPSPTSIASDAQLKDQETFASKEADLVRLAKSLHGEFEAVGITQLTGAFNKIERLRTTNVEQRNGNVSKYKDGVRNALIAKALAGLNHVSVAAYTEAILQQLTLNVPKPGPVTKALSDENQLQKIAKTLLVNLQGGRQGGKDRLFEASDAGSAQAKVQTILAESQARLAELQKARVDQENRIRTASEQQKDNAAKARKQQTKDAVIPKATILLNGLTKEINPLEGKYKAAMAEYKVYESLYTAFLNRLKSDDNYVPSAENLSTVKNEANESLIKESTNNAKFQSKIKNFLGQLVNLRVGGLDGIAEEFSRIETKVRKILEDTEKRLTDLRTTIGSVGTSYITAMNALKAKKGIIANAG